ncbi:hypothetical protein BDN70DRAFT_876766 [Pholiota conissans]|uniref:Uncharacterized protein n=1 Tax=Pholiota conissans TaxID=109636 RepID=A0A9P5Z4U2_9AGAR|nr:hypothetical protein BDN70DRAFT_876766 [Pholiota conissans]
MFSRLSSFAVVLLAAGAAVAAPLIINTPVDVVSGQPVLITWSGGAAPFTVKVNEFGPPPVVVATFGPLDSTSVVWNVDVPAGTVVDFSVQDKHNALAQSGSTTVQ